MPHSVDRFCIYGQKVKEPKKQFSFSTEKDMKTKKTDHFRQKTKHKPKNILTLKYHNSVFQILQITSQDAHLITQNENTYQRSHCFSKLHKFTISNQLSDYQENSSINNHTAFLWPSWILSRNIQVSWHQKGKTKKVKPIWIYWSKR